MQQTTPRGFKCEVLDKSKFQIVTGTEATDGLSGCP